ncbi:uncharacterized protein LOC127585816 [Pristis pectinata]|uniref:uncharacterized protein LOC127585816 n=1 Tax=Pristis pectinata TaxID=685728 RepID=UPI00223CFE55|nr:uncharacterized protein LOC127585816 [Pristis pectinata]
MASKGQVESLTEEAICPICLDFFTDPVILECGHNFCRFCITRCWEKEERNSCPECREEFADRTLRVNRALASLSEKARKLNLNPIKRGSKHHCEEHEEELKLFCETEKKLICLICRDAREHREHRFLPIKEAVEIYKDQIKSSLESLTKKKSAVQETEQQQKEKISRVREQSHSLQFQITSQFAELHQILTEKEQHLLRDLREEEEKILNPMEKKLQEIQENLNSIQEKLSKLQERMNQEDSVIFLKEEARRKRRISDDEQSLSVTDGALPVEKFDHLFLLKTALREVFDTIKRVSVTLDVGTAGPWLEVSEDRKGVRWTRTRRSLPDTGKRFTVWYSVLGSEGFTSGRHYWEVEVAGSRGWSLGVAAESVERKRWVGLIPENGFWSIGQDGHGLYVNTSPPSRLPAGPIPGRVGVYLSYGSGTVSFYSADTKSHLHTFTGNKFTEKLYPFFGTWDENQWLRICSGSAPGLLDRTGVFWKVEVVNESRKQHRYRHDVPEKKFRFQPGDGDGGLPKNLCNFTAQDPHLLLATACRIPQGSGESPRDAISSRCGAAPGSQQQEAVSAPPARKGFAAPAGVVAFARAAAPDLRPLPGPTRSLFQTPARPPLAALSVPPTHWAGLTLTNQSQSGSPAGVPRSDFLTRFVYRPLHVNRTPSAIPLGSRTGSDWPEGEHGPLSGRDAERWERRAGRGLEQGASGPGERPQMGSCSSGKGCDTGRGRETFPCRGCRDCGGDSVRSLSYTEGERPFPAVDRGLLSAAAPEPASCCWEPGAAPQRLLMASLGLSPLPCGIRQAEGRVRTRRKACVVDNRGTAGVQQLAESERNVNQEVQGVNMASKGQVESLTEEAICPICLDFFTDPVTLECGHNFCRFCITRCWESAERNSCPECREVFADRTLRVNRALARLSEKLRNLNLNPKEKESKLHCEEHEEELKLFCETDKKLICVICAAAREHKSHNFMPVKEAVKIYKDRVKSSLESLTEKKSVVQEMERQQKEKISRVREQSHNLQSHITSQFAELHQILTEKEQRLLRDLREEEARILNSMEKNLREIQEHLTSIQEDLSDLQEQMDQGDSMIFLKLPRIISPETHIKIQFLSLAVSGSGAVGVRVLCQSVGSEVFYLVVLCGYMSLLQYPLSLCVSGSECWEVGIFSSLGQIPVVGMWTVSLSQFRFVLYLFQEEVHWKRRISDEHQALSVTDAALLFEKFDHPILFNTALRKVFDTIQQVSVTLDVETASPELEVSEDRKSVRWTRTRRDLPDTGKRFTDWECVLGSEGFTSGRHYWEVEVAGSRGWGLGVAAESVQRKEEDELIPETGFWVIGRDGHALYVNTSPPSLLPAGRIPGRVGVYLGYGSGTVSFYSADTKSHLHTFTGNKFTEKLYPFFWTWDGNRWLRICSGSAPGL